jgi:hypothetical protein
MLQQYLTPEIVVMAAGTVCLFAVIVLVLAGRRAFIRGMVGKLAALETQVEQRQQILEDTGQRMVEAAELQKRVDHLDKRFSTLRQDIQPLEAKHLKAVNDYEDAKGDLYKTREEWTQLREKVDLYKDRVAKVEALEQEIAALQEQREELEALVKDLPNRQTELGRVEEAIVTKQRELDVQQQTLKKMEVERKALEERMDAERKALKERMESECKALNEIKQKELEAWQQKLRQMEVERKALEERMDTERKILNEKIADGHKAVKQCEEDLRQRKEEIGKLENAKIDLDARLETLSDRLKNVGKMPLEAFESLNVSVFPLGANTRKKTDEKVALANMRQLVEATGFEIPVRLQNAFHTALKTSDISCLTVMAGVSGTGKSAFPKLYAQAMGLHFLPLAVEPRWDSPKDLFGFLNYMENRFEATALGRSLVQFNESPHNPGFPNNPNNPGSLKDQMLLVMLDEMNLARIEYYFSEFLSKLEMRRNSDVNNMEDYRNVSVEIYAGHPGDAENKPNAPVHLYAGSNVLFVGTMNEDETTQSLSDKVIDRANVLYFGKPNRLSERRQRVVPVENWTPMGATAWRDWIKEVSADTIPAYAQINDLVNSINGTLARLGRPFAWRTYKAIMAYVANHPDVISQADRGLRPLADQVAMRVMPKLRGVDLVEHGDVFNALGQLIRQVNDHHLQEAFDRARESKQGFFDWRGISWEG